MSEETNTIEGQDLVARRIGWLAMLQGSDPGVFVLAVHSFIESWLRERIELDDPADERFTSYLYELKCQIEARNPGITPRLFEVLSFLAKSDALTNEVRHRFASLAVEEAREATQHLLKFCELVNIKASLALEKVQTYLEAASFSGTSIAGDSSPA